MRRALLAFGAIGLLAAPVCINEPIAAFADGSDPEATSTISRYESEETSSSFIEASSGVVSEGAGDPEEAWYDRAFEWVDNKVVPLFGASTLTAIVSFVASVALAIAKRRGDKRNGALIKSQADDIAKFQSEQADLVLRISGLLDTLSGKLEENAREMAELGERYQQAVSESKAQTERLKSIDGMRAVLSEIAKLDAKALLLDEKAVKAGYGKEAKKALDRLEKADGAAK